MRLRQFYSGTAGKIAALRHRRARQLVERGKVSAVCWHPGQDHGVAATGGIGFLALTLKSREQKGRW